MQYPLEVVAVEVGAITSRLGLLAKVMHTLYKVVIDVVTEVVA